MANDVIWIVTDEPPAVIIHDDSRDGQDTGNPYDEPDRTIRTDQRRGTPVAAEKLEQGMMEFVQIMGRILQHTQQSTSKLAGMELDEIELLVEVNSEGQLSLLGMGGKAGAKGAMTLKFKALKP